MNSVHRSNKGCSSCDDHVKFVEENLAFQEMRHCELAYYECQLNCVLYLEGERLEMLFSNKMTTCTSSIRQMCGLAKLYVIVPLR